VSLVSEALRKARHDAATHGRLLRGDIFQSAPASPARRTRLGPGFVLGGSFTLVAVLVGAALTWWAVKPHTQPAATQVAVASPSPAAPAPPPAQSSTSLALQDQRDQTPAHQPPSQEPVHGATAEPSTEQPGARETPPLSRTQAASTALPARPGAVAAAQTAADKAASDEANETTPAASDEQTYVLRADLGYAKLQLDYLVYKPSAPFGRVNGHDVVPGSIVDGFLVEEIGPDYIKLKDSRSMVILRLH